MHVQVIKAQSRRKLLSETRRLLGPDALILSVRKEPGPKPGEFEWEAVVGMDHNDGEFASNVVKKLPLPEHRPPRLELITDVQPPSPPPVTKRDLSPVVIHPAAQKLMEVRSSLVQQLDTVSESSGQNTDELLRMGQRLAQLESDLLTNLMQELDIPIRFVPVLRDLYSSGYPEGEALRLLSMVRHHTDGNNDIEMARFKSCLRKVIAREVKVANTLHDSEPGISVFVGSSGAGKSAMAAKLAADLRVRKDIRPVLGVLKPDRAIGVALMRRYADCLDLDFVQIRTRMQLEHLVEMAEHTRVILDTPGISPFDERRLRGLKKTLVDIPRADVHTVVSNTMGQTDLLSALESFAHIGVQNFAVTRLDEAPYPGRVLTAAARSGLALSYLSNGTQIPDDLIRPRLKNLLSSVMEPKRVIAS